MWWYVRASDLGRRLAETEMADREFSKALDEWESAVEELRKAAEAVEQAAQAESEEKNSAKAEHEAARERIQANRDAFRAIADEVRPYLSDRDDDVTSTPLDRPGAIEWLDERIDALVSGELELSDPESVFEILACRFEGRLKRIDPGSSQCSSRLSEWVEEQEDDLDEYFDEQVAYYSVGEMCFGVLPVPRDRQADRSPYTVVNGSEALVVEAGGLAWTLWIREQPPEACEQCGARHGWLERCQEEPFETRRRRWFRRRSLDGHSGDR